MPTPYFTKMPVIAYDFNGDGVQTVITDISHRARIRKILKNNLFVYYEYNLQDGDKPEDIAFKYYGDSNYFWVVMFSNDIYDRFYDWLMTYDDLNAFIISKFGDIRTAKQATHHYEDGSGNEIDFKTYIDVGDPSIIVSQYDYYYLLNESKRKIKLLDAKYLGKVEQELTDLMNQLLN